MADIPYWAVFLFVWLIFIMAGGAIALAVFFIKVESKSKSLQLQLNKILKSLESTSAGAETWAGTNTRMHARQSVASSLKEPQGAQSDKKRKEQAAFVNAKIAPSPSDNTGQ